MILRQELNMLQIGNLSNKIYLFKPNYHISLLFTV